LCLEVSQSLSPSGPIKITSLPKRIVRCVTIRRAIPAERRTLEALQWRASLGNEGDRDALLRHPDAIDLPQEQIAAGAVFVLEQDGAIVGFSAIMPRDDGDTELDALFVEPSIQRRGIGRKLIEHCAEMARSTGSSALHVVGNSHAKQFYLSCGFSIVGTFETRFGLGLLMRRTLTSP
jgi:GNAT superfamily N-acetyltransferase